MLECVKASERPAASGPLLAMNASQHSLIDTREEGVIVILLAIASFLMVLLSIGFTIDLPTTQGSVSRTQSALDIGGAHGVLSYWNPLATANATFINADSVLRAAYSATATGVYSGGFAAANNKHALAVPLFGRRASGTDWTVYNRYVCTSNTPDSCVQSAPPAELGPDLARLILQTWDPIPGPTGVDDWNNGVSFLSLIHPYNYLGILGTVDTKIASTVRLKNVMPYFLIDPAFSMGADADGNNYNRIFGRFTPGLDDGLTDTEMWPVAGAREKTGSLREDMHYPMPSGVNLSGLPEYNTDWSSGFLNRGMAANLFDNQPVTGADFISLGASENDTRRIYQFYAETCDTLPFFHFKSAAINLLDRMASSSAYSSTTLISLTGYTHSLPLVYVHPQNDENETFTREISDYPLPEQGSSTIEPHNWYLHRGKPKMFAGYLNSKTPLSTNTAPYHQMNKWELGYCRGLYGSDRPSAPTTGFVLPEDWTQSPTAILSHEPVNTRYRDTLSASNWIDDVTDLTANPDVSTEIGLSRNGGSGTCSSTSCGETKRNVVGNLAIRAVNPKIETAAPPNASWTPGVNAWQPPNSNDMKTGFRYLPEALVAACLHLEASRNAYNLDVVYNEERPIADDAIVVYAFGIYSQLALDTLPTGARTHERAILDFYNALRTCACDHPQRKIFLNFLPMDDVDRAQVYSAASDAIQPFEGGSNARCVGQIDPTDPCGGAESAKVYTFIYDWTSDRFQSLPNGAAASTGIRKILAAEAFNKETHEIISRMLLEYEYVI